MIEQKLTKELEAKKAELLSLQEETVKVRNEATTSRQLLTSVIDLKGIIGKAVVTTNVREPTTS